MTNTKKENSKDFEEVRRPDVTASVFKDAVRKLQDEHKELSVRNIRAITGGSNSTIAKLLREYQRSTLMNSFNEEMPQSYQEGVIKLSKDLFAHFSALVAQERVRLQNDYDRMNAEIADAIEQADEKAKVAQQQAEAVMKENSELKQRIKELEKSNNSLTLQNANLTSQLESIHKDSSKQIMEAIFKLSEKIKV